MAAEQSGPEFVGQFDIREQTYLRGQFGACRLELLARSRSNPSIVLLKWQPLLRRSQVAPAPLFDAPSHASYVLDMRLIDSPLPAAPREPDPGNSPAPSDGGPPRTGDALRRVDSTEALHAQFSAHFPGVVIQAPRQSLIGRIFRRLMPGGF